MDLLPLSTVESDHYRQHIRAHDSKAKGVTTKKVKERMRQFEANIREAMLLSMQGNWISLTIDHWTSVAKQSYSGMTSHWIGEDFVLQSRVLGCWLHEGDSESASLVDDFVTSLFTRCNFDKANIIAVVSDTTSNMNKFGMMLELLKVPHMYCTDHQLQLTAKKAYKDEMYRGIAGLNNNNADVLEVGVGDLETMKKTRALVEYFSRSNQKLADLKNQQEIMPNVYLRAPVGVIVDVVTRWWSTYAMCDRLLYLKPALLSMVINETLSEARALSEIDWNVIALVHTVLKPFKLAQELLEGEKYVTISWIPTALQGIRKQLTAVVEDAAIDTEAQRAVKNLATRLLHDFRTRWLDERDVNQPAFTGNVIRGTYNRQYGIHPIISIATALDPRFKKLKSYSIGDQERIWDALLKKSQLRGLFLHPEEVCQVVDPIVEVPEANVVRAASATDYFHELIDSESDEEVEVDLLQQIPQQCSDEIEAYRKLPRLPIKRGRTNTYNNPLEWWKMRSLQFPILSKLARMYLCIPATSAPTERIFSLASRLISKARSQLDPETAGTIIYVNKNLVWYEELVTIADLQLQQL